MSVELPDLDRLLGDAAQRRYGPVRRRRRRLRLAMVAVAACAAIIAVAVSVTPGDVERTAEPAPRDPLVAAYGSLGDPALVIDPEPEEALDPAAPVVSRLLYDRDGVRIVATTGARPDGERMVCVRQRPTQGAAIGCRPARELLADRAPWVHASLGLGPDPTKTVLVAFVPDGIATLRVWLASGRERQVAVTRNAAFATLGSPVCEVRWTDADGTSHTQHQGGGPTCWG